MFDKYIKKIKKYYELAKIKKVDRYLIIAGVIGTTIGLWLGISIINQIFVWLILFGVSIKLYDFTEKIERNIIPYDFNKLLPPPPKNKK